MKTYSLGLYVMKVCFSVTKGTLFIYKLIMSLVSDRPFRFVIIHFVIQSYKSDNDTTSCIENTSQASMRSFDRRNKCKDLLTTKPAPVLSHRGWVMTSLFWPSILFTFSKGHGPCFCDQLIISTFIRESLSPDQCD